MKLTAAERAALPDSAFALPKFREFPMHDWDHTRAAAGRISQAWHEGRISSGEHEEALTRLRRAERKFGITPGLGSYAGFSDDLEDKTGLSTGAQVAIGAGVVGALGLLVWKLWPTKPDMTAEQAQQLAHAVELKTAGEIAINPVDYVIGKIVSGPGLQALAASLTPAQKAAVHAAKARGLTGVQALQAAGITPAQLAAAAR